MRFELKKSALLFCLGVFGCSVGSFAENVLVEAESFRDKGGWVVDQQFMDLMGFFFWQYTCNGFNGFSLSYGTRNGCTCG